MTISRPLSVAIIGAGPAGIYAADILTKSDIDVRIDLFEKLPAPYGLVRYGVAPDHPRIKLITDALRKVLEPGTIRLVGNVDIGGDVTVERLRDHYDVVLLATGANRDAPLPLPGSELPGNHGAAEFVSWYDGHPDAPRTWPLDAESVAVLGAGNVALDISRVLTRRVEDLIRSDIPDNVAEGLRASAVRDLHLFARRGPAHAKFSAVELRELGKLPGVEIVVDAEDFVFDAAATAQVEASSQVKRVVTTLTEWALREPGGTPAERRIHLHFFHRPVEVLGAGRVTGLRTERTEYTGDGTVRGTGEFIDTQVQAVYRAVGYFSSPIPGVPFDEVAGVVPNAEGRVLDAEGEPIAGLYATGWIKRGPVGLIGSTKSDAQETIGHILADLAEGRVERAAGEPDALLETLADEGVETIGWRGWEQLDAHERSLGEAQGRERVKVVSREEMTAIARGAVAVRR